MAKTINILKVPMGPSNKPMQAANFTSPAPILPKTYPGNKIPPPRKNPIRLGSTATPNRPLPLTINASNAGSNRKTKATFGTR